tara:strand:- start:12 stop:497 length:486 start_codon:yes stop_codon:yes gene_type:complete
MNHVPPEHQNMVTGLLMNTRSKPGAFRNRQFNNVTDPRLIYSYWQSLPSKRGTRISLTNTFQPHVIKQTRRPARRNTYYLPKHAGKNLLIHSGNHWNVLRAINGLEKEFHRKFNESRGLPLNKRLKIGTEYQRTYNSNKLIKQALRNATNNERFNYALRLG